MSAYGGTGLWCRLSPTTKLPYPPFGSALGAQQQPEHEQHQPAQQHTKKSPVSNHRQTVNPRCMITLEGAAGSNQQGLFALLGFASTKSCAQASEVEPLQEPEWSEERVAPPTSLLSPGST
mmetsp:Transcript_68315/g.154550  ORF Transcript_68315/g.154550 Transcript_68315/m.154550 type:complete len:121 (+) Transcript_68315:406-768(+)|eukprot:CAMPEP_0172590136 /NCGR_PEP_ID=MMETSP1068-20121228/8573_1 /TAXON_ID=35684 /ORGANISM="Pseudopedinella elastica, Strain CCMP716" /LENGTH=120 /DNA_ID=CAMNT_0013385835 /DNA_START=362 /DNA_END=724 /DNA_ORIENTATION=+